MNNPHHGAGLTVYGREQIVVRLRSGPNARELAEAFGVSLRTIPTWLARRYPRGRPGELIHLDVKTLGRFGRPGHRATGTRSGGRGRSARWHFVHVAVDDATRLADVEALADERRGSATASLLRALRWFRSHDVRAERVMTDNGSAYRSGRFARALRFLRVRHIFTRPSTFARPHTPRTNGKASPSQRPRTGGGPPLDIRTHLRGWAYGLAHPTSAAPNADLPRWLDGFNTSQPQTALKGLPPLAVVENLRRTHR